MLLPHRAPYFPLYIGAVIVTLGLVFYLRHPLSHITSWKGITIPLTSTETSAASLIPKKIWYKLGPRGLNDQSREWTDTCINKNPSYKSEFLTDNAADEYVRKHFESRPDIVETYLALTLPILKADLLRYLLLYSEGGIWSDLDVSCEDIPISDWIPEYYKRNASLVVGWEFDMGYGLGWGDGFIRQLATWTVMAAPKSRHMLMIIDDIMEGMHKKTKEHNCTIADLSFATIGDVVDLTGPRRMTKSIIKSLNIASENIENGKAPAHYVPRLIQDVLILPGYAFANSTNRYGPGVVPGPPFVTHHYAGTWKNEHGGEVADPVLRP